MTVRLRAVGLLALGLGACAAPAKPPLKQTGHAPASSATLKGKPANASVSGPAKGAALKPAPPSVKTKPGPAVPPPAAKAVPVPIVPPPLTKSAPAPLVPPPPDTAVVLTDAPYFLAAKANLNDFRFFANGGFDAGWNVGYNTCWVIKLPPAPAGPWARAFVGAKLGAAKTQTVPGRPGWDQQPVPGEIQVAIASEPSWPQSRRRPLVNAEELPLAGHSTYPLDGVGEARWVWTEIPLSEVSSSSPNFVALFSPDERLKGPARCPVLAGAASDNRPNAWLNSQVSGQPPATSTEATRTPVGVREPAIAIKLVQFRDQAPVVTLRSPPDRLAAAGGLTLWAAVEGVDVESAWVEVSTDGKVWRRSGRSAEGAPYQFSFTRDQLPRGTFQVRVAAKDLWEQVGVSAPATVKAGRY